MVPLLAGYPVGLGSYAGDWVTRSIRRRGEPRFDDLDVVLEFDAWTTFGNGFSPFNRCLSVESPGFRFFIRLGQIGLHRQTASRACPVSPPRSVNADS
jgi:hypothetical protein